ncbi:unnamed protein product [Echinostoma caproni]|uniref:Uncharacterized protein n=1 Tax=Echinostoma caproni TaxID=27848 RepID=A0A3P8CKM5_9TREM|nr:unnamed protein product [Echinostoma caproni]
MQFNDGLIPTTLIPFGSYVVDRAKSQVSGLQFLLMNSFLTRVGVLVFCAPSCLTDRVLFIDYEFCGFNHAAFDIANHFCEYGDGVRLDRILHCYDIDLTRLHG